MKITASALLAILALLFGPVSAVAQPQKAAPSRTIDSSNSSLLSPEKQKLIREFVAIHERTATERDKLPRLDEAFEVGSPVPGSAHLFAHPMDQVNEAPRITSYRFTLAKNGILVVDPSTRVVIQIIE